MDTLYNKNGLIFWTEEEIRLRNMFVNYFVMQLRTALKSENRAFELMQVEAPILTPQEFINKNYSPTDYFQVPYDNLVLRPETTMGSYQYAQWLLEHTETKTRLPICIWQHGKSFRKEQDQVTKNMRLKEFYQLEFQCIYGQTTANDYSLSIIPAVNEMISDMIGPCHTEASDRLPDYSEKTIDVVCNKSNMEVCSISLRKDFPNAKVLEIAIGTDRCVYNFTNK
jgi:glycyl-tRNA synthetase